MSSDLIGLVLDVVVLGFLVATIFYVIRLSKGLSDFKAHRREFDGIITSLLSSIDQAERSVASLKQVSSQEASELSRLVKQAKAMSEELQIINEAGENMAKRLEKTAEKNREIAQSSRPSMGAGFSENNKISSPVPFKSGKSKSKAKKNYRSTLKTAKRNEDESELPSFMIQDREFEDLGSLESHLDSSVSNDELPDDMPEELQSQAEKELLAALRSNNKHKGSSRGGF